MHDFFFYTRIGVEAFLGFLISQNNIDNLCKKLIGHHETYRKVFSDFRRENNGGERAFEVIPSAAQAH